MIQRSDIEKIGEELHRNVYVVHTHIRNRAPGNKQRIHKRAEPDALCQIETLPGNICGNGNNQDDVVRANEGAEVSTGRIHDNYADQAA